VAGSTTALAPLEAKRRRPAIRAGLVPRPRLARRLLGSADLPLALLVAPAGYGKTTLLSQWAERDRRPFAWLTLDRGDNDLLKLLASIASVLDSIEPIDGDLRAALSASRPRSSTVLARLLSCLESRSRSFVLVLDDAHLLGEAHSIEALNAIVRHLQWGSQLALASRDEPPLRVGRLRANRNVVELRFSDMAMTRSEGGALLSAAGLDPCPDEVETILARTEGWPAGLYLAALSLCESEDRAAALASFGGADRLIADYLRDEVLSGLTANGIAFLTRAAVLDRPSGPACDAVLERSGSGRVLARAERGNLLVFPAEEAGCYRYHPLLADMLRAELRRSDPDLERQLHRRAATWYARKGARDCAVAHAIAAHDPGLVGELLWADLPRLVNYGHNSVIQRWLDHFTDDEVAAEPKLALVAAGSRLVGGDRDLAEHWVAAAARSMVDGPPTDATLEAGLAVMRASVASDGVARMVEDAARAYELFPQDSPWRSVCCLLVGVGRHLGGDRDRAHSWLEEGVRRGAVGAPSIQALCLAQLALLAIEDGDWAGAATHATRAHAQVERFGLAGYPTAGLVFAVSAAVRAQNGHVDGATIDVRRATDLIARLTDFAPWYEIEARIALASAAFRLSDGDGARGHLAVAARLLRRSPDAVVLGRWLEQSWSRVESTPRPEVNGRWSLTTAELRVLQFLPTHLSFPQIAQRLNVSANTVKTHSRAVYRKLDACSRAEAVAQARAAGLIDAYPAAVGLAA
jgi:LuxR family maltose regulon positive regulatory protein